MLKNNYSMVIESLEDELTKVNLFKTIENVNDIVLRIEYITQNFEEHLIFAEDLEEAAAQAAALDDIGDEFEKIKEALKDHTYMLLQYMNDHTYLTEEDKKGLLEEE